MHKVDIRLHRYQAVVRQRRHRSLERAAHEGENIPLLDQTEQEGWIEKYLMAEDMRRRRTRMGWRW